MTLTFDLLILKVVSDSHVTWATSVPILVSLGLSVLDLDPMYATDRRQTDVVRQYHGLMPPPIRGGVITTTTIMHVYKAHIVTLEAKSVDMHMLLRYFNTIADY